MATHSGILAMDQEPGRLQSTESQTVGHNWIDFAHRTYNTLYTKKHPSLYHGEFFRVLKTFSYFTFYFHWLLDAIVRVDSFPLYRDNQTSGNSVNLHHSIPEAEQTADSEHFDLCSVDLLRKQSSKPLPTRLALGGCTMPSPTPAAPLCSHHIPCSTFWGGGWGWGGSLPPHTSLRPQHITQSKSQTAHVLPPHRCSDIFRNPGVCQFCWQRSCESQSGQKALVTENAKTGQWLSPYVSTVLLPTTADSASTERHSTVSCSETRCEEVWSAAVCKCLIGGHLCCQVNGDSEGLETGVYGMSSESLTHWSSPLHAEAHDSWKQVLKRAS